MSPQFKKPRGQRGGPLYPLDAPPITRQIFRDTGTDEHGVPHVKMLAGYWVPAGTAADPGRWFRWAQHYALAVKLGCVREFMRRHDARVDAERAARILGAVAVRAELAP